MGRCVAVAAALMTLVACGGTGYLTTRPPVGQFLAPGATHVQITALGWNEWQISYRAPGSPTTWYTDVPRQLEARRWSSQDRVEYGSLTRTYTHVVSLGLCELWEWAFLAFDPLHPHDAQIKVRRWIAFPGSTSEPGGREATW